VKRQIADRDQVCRRIAGQRTGREPRFSHPQADRCRPQPSQGANTENHRPRTRARWVWNVAVPASRLAVRQLECLHVAAPTIRTFPWWIPATNSPSPRGFFHASVPSSRFRQYSSPESPGVRSPAGRRWSRANRASDSGQAGSSRLLHDAGLLNAIAGAGHTVRPVPETVAPRQRSLRQADGHHLLGADRHTSTSPKDTATTRLARETSNAGAEDVLERLRPIELPRRGNPHQQPDFAPDSASNTGGGRAPAGPPENTLPPAICRIAAIPPASHMARPV